MPTHKRRFILPHLFRVRGFSLYLGCVDSGAAGAIEEQSHICKIVA